LIIERPRPQGCVTLDCDENEARWEEKLRKVVKQTSAPGKPDD